MTTPFKLGDHVRWNSEAGFMCSEAVWWRCHRRIVSDYLIARGETVLHITAPHRVEPAHLTAGAVIRPDGTIVYPDAGDDATAPGATAPPNA